MRAIDPDRFVRHVGRRVAELRAELGWTQEQLAEHARVSLKYLQRIEAGRENLTLRSVARLANHLRVPPAELFVPPRSRRPKRGRPPSAR